MNITAKSVATGAWALALAALLASTSFAETRPRHSTGGDHGSAGARDARSSRQATPRVESRADRGSSSKPAEASRPRVESRSPQWTSRDRSPRGSGAAGSSSNRDWTDRGNTPRTPTPRVEVRSKPIPAPQWQSRPRDGAADRDRGDWRPSPQRRTPVDLGRGGHSDSRDDSRYDSRRDSRWGRDPRWDGRHDYGYRDDGRRGDHRHRSFEGRVHRIVHGHGGYNIWLDNCLHPFWIPEARFLLWPLRVGLSVRLGGYWNPGGYYSVYDSGPVAGPYYSTTLLQGIVEGYDWSSGMLVVRDDRTGSYVNVYLRTNELDPGNLRPGDWIAFSGAWTNNGYFEAYRVEDLQYR